MKNFFIGLILGIVITGAAGYFQMNDMKQASYDSGFAAGNKKGITTGTADGLTQGIAKGMADAQAAQMRTSDSIALVEKQHEAMAMRKAAIKRRNVVKPIQNWHVINGQLGAPIPDTTK